MTVSSGSLLHGACSWPCWCVGVAHGCNKVCVSVVAAPALLIWSQCIANHGRQTEEDFFHEYTSNCNYSSGANVNNISTTFMQVCLLALVTMTEQLLSVFQDWMVEWWNKIIIFSYECLIHKGRKRAGHKSLCVMYSCAFRRFLTSWLKDNVAYKFLCLEVR